MSGCGTVDDIVHIEKLFSLKTFAEDTSAHSPEGFLRDVETLAVQVTRIQGVEKMLEKV